MGHFTPGLQIRRKGGVLSREKEANPPLGCGALGHFGDSAWITGKREVICLDKTRGRGTQRITVEIRRSRKLALVLRRNSGILSAMAIYQQLWAIVNPRTS